MYDDDDLLGRLDRADEQWATKGQSLYAAAAAEIRRLRGWRERRRSLDDALDATRTRILDVLVEAGGERHLLDDLETWELIIKYRTDPTLFPNEGARP